MNVLKFGGTSVSSKISLQNMRHILRSYDLEQEPVLVVVSALKGITNELLSLLDALETGGPTYKEVLERIVNRHDDFVNFLFETELENSKAIVKEIEKAFRVKVAALAEKGRVTDADYDEILSFGELFSANIITCYLQSYGLDFRFKDARGLIITDDNHKNARVNWEQTAKAIRTFFVANPGNFVITGFIGATETGSTTTLGRGGSDYTATILGTVLGANSVTKWTDVNGIMTADPNKVPKAHSLTNISFDELKNLSKFGSNVLVHPESIGQLSKNNIPFVIRNTFNRNFRGTQVINGDRSAQKALSLHQACSIISFEKEWNLPKNFTKEIIDKDYLFFRIKTSSNDGRSYYVVADECIHFFTPGTGTGVSGAQFSEMIRKVVIEKRNIALITITSQSMDKKQELIRINEVLSQEGIPVVGFRMFFNSISLIFDKGNFKEVLELLHNCLLTTDLTTDVVV
ncbi:putative Aspartate kinase [Tenacibaculum litopenaei]|uniref:aspartate kinase n=1 Tax=Tenacibaculum litopenaei TaxID=396016 RepID=UPI003895A789